MRFHKDGTIPTVPDDGSTIFVFGSNLAGRHGKGAAQIALSRYGAEPGVGIGPQGWTYAIPTKDERLSVLSLELISLHVDDFIKFAKSHPRRSFFVTRVGCGLARYSDKDIAPLFRGAPDNCSFAESWKKFLVEASQ